MSSHGEKRKLHLLHLPDLVNPAGTGPIKAFILKGFAIVREQAPLSIANSPLPDLAEKLPGVGFIAERIFDIISCNDETSRICSTDSASSVEALSADGDNGCRSKSESRLDGAPRSVAALDLAVDR